MAGVTRRFSLIATARMKLPAFGRTARGVLAANLFAGFTSFAWTLLLNMTKILEMIRETRAMITAIHLISAVVAARSCCSRRFEAMRFASPADCVASRARVTTCLLSGL